ncbi:MAG: Multidrug resistance protein MdtM [Chlamydiae bacterium]|nr:Multidrug resistance protein MdtM [Chlamydiota bacterium]
MKKSTFILALFPFLFVLYELSGNLTNDMFLPALLQIANDFGVSPSLVQITITSWLVGQSISYVLLGPLSDRFGRKTILVSGGLAFVVATAACALSENVVQLLVFRIFQGAGVASILISGYASVHELYDTDRATRILTWTSSAAVVAPMMGPLMGSWVLLFGSWQDIFWIIFVFSLLILAILIFIMPESLEKKDRLSLNPQALGISYLNILKNRSFMMRSFTFDFHFGAMIGWTTTSPVIVMKVYDYSPTAFGYLQIPVFVGFILGAQIARYMLSRVGRDPIIRAGVYTLLIGGVGMVIAALFFSETLFGLLAMVSLSSMGFGLAAAPLSKEALLTTKEGTGITTAVFFLLMFGTGSLVSMGISLIEDTPLVIALFVFCLGLLASLTFRMRGKLPA